MKNSILSVTACVMCLCMAVSCQEKSGEDKFPEEPGAIYSVSGNVQKGPFAQGTAITIQALDESLNPTGQNYSTTTYDDFGAFSIGSQIESRYVEIVANGYYYNEVAGSLSKSQITLRSISDLSEDGNTNINLLTTLESDRIRWLVTNEDMEVADARRQAEQEIYDVFHIPLEVGDSGFDKADISKAGDGNAVLLAISATLQGSRTEAELSELIAKISSELQNTGTLGKSDLAEQIRTGGMGLDYRQIASNLEARYSQLGLRGYVIPPFEDFLDINGNGVIDRDDQWLLVSDAQYSVPQSGGEYSLTVEHNVDYDVTVEEGCDWISVSSGAGTKAYLESGNYTVTIGANNTFATRTAGITFKARESSQEVTVYVVQEASVFNLSQTYFYLDNTAQVIEVSVTSSSEDYHAEFPEGSEWISESGSDSGVLRFEVEANNDFSSDREGRIIFSDNAGNLLGEITVIQDRASMSIEQERFDLDNKSQSFVLKISSSTDDYGVSVTEGTEWLAITSHSGGEWTFSTYLNSSYQPRDGVITVSDMTGAMLDTIPVNQWCETVTQVNVTPGNLESLITQPGQLEYTETFIAEGEMNEHDFLYLRRMPSLKNIDISELINTTLPKSVFHEMKKLEKLVLPNNLESIPYAMCSYCDNLKEVFPLPESVTVIGEEAFLDCFELSGNLILHEGIERIETGAFSRCENLTGDLVIPSTVTFMGGYGYIFRGCEKIEKVYMKPAVPPQTSEGYDMFPNYNYLGVPVGSKNLYEADDHYNKFMVIEEVDFEALGL
ncbi:MAG TPA: leucine-rich repeat protein [Candidatus Coprenecus stercorigallinarum]|nr:leucine-rich repeat protein [Candidatus Coprenecus stercorigallinarum]